MKKDNFCYPSDFFWINRDQVKMRLKENPLRTYVALIMYFFLAPVAFVGYYLFMPFRLFHEWCESWCYR